DRRSHPTGFWKDHERVREYNALSKFTERMNGLKTEIEMLEMNASVSFLGQASDDVRLPTQLTNWTSEAQVFKKDLVAHVNREYNSCVLGLYGVDLEKIYNMYRVIVRRLGIQMSGVWPVWHRNSYYEELVSDPENPEVKVKREEYYYTEEEWFTGTSGDYRQPTAEKSGDKLVGLEFKIDGPVAYLLMSGESGFQHWLLPGHTEPTPYWVQVMPFEQHATPKRVHRLDFFTAKPRRIMAPGTYSDKNYNIEAATESEFLDAVAQHCQAYMIQEVNLAVM
ncbi:MAG TPA: hypothetical protein PK198_07140, partial [Saprospiraceae bacterium]|nr:hypothetical protein [Saprospiraceae bacterium]